MEINILASLVPDYSVNLPGPAYLYDIVETVYAESPLSAAGRKMTFDLHSHISISMDSDQPGSVSILVRYGISFVS